MRLTATAMGARSHPSSAQRGFSLVELMVAIAIFGILATLAIPIYGQFVANTQIRTATESMLTGVRLAQTEAVKRNGTVEFVLDPATGWTVNDLSDPNNVVPLRNVLWIGGSKQTTVTNANGLTRVTFNGLGRLARNIDGTNPLAQVDVTTNTTVASPRNLRLIVGPAFQDATKFAVGIKVCDPAFPVSDPAGCP